MSLFKRGFSEVKKEEKRREEAKKQMGGLFRFYLSEGEALVTFLTEEPISFYEHTLKGKRNGKDFYDNVPCSGADCPHCADGDRPSFKSAWLMIDHRPYEYTDKDGKKKKKKATLKLYVVGTKIAGVLQRKANRYGLTKFQYIIERIGKDTNTTYTLENGDKVRLKEDAIRKLMTDELNEIYDGTMDSLYEIVEHEIERLIPKDVAVGDDDDDYEDDDDYDKNMISYDDDEDEDDDEDDYVPPKKSSKKATKTLKTKKKSLKLKRK